MPTHIALLRGINVGGHNKVAMAELRQVMKALGHTDGATGRPSPSCSHCATPDLQTGNIGSCAKRTISKWPQISIRCCVVGFHPPGASNTEGSKLAYNREQSSAKSMASARTDGTVQ